MRVRVSGIRRDKSGGFYHDGRVGKLQWFAMWLKTRGGRQSPFVAVSYGGSLL